MTTAENEKILQRFYAFSPATIKNVSKTIIPHNIKFLLSTEVYFKASNID